MMAVTFWWGAEMNGHHNKKPKWRQTTSQGHSCCRGQSRRITITRQASPHISLVRHIPKANHRLVSRSVISADFYQDSTALRRVKKGAVGPRYTYETPGGPASSLFSSPSPAVSDAQSVYHVNLVSSPMSTAFLPSLALSSANPTQSHRSKPTSRCNQFRFHSYTYSPRPAHRTLLFHRYPLIPRVLRPQSTPPAAAPPVTRLSPRAMQGGQALLASALVTTLYQSLFFALAYALDTDHLTDFAGTSNIALLAALSLLYSARTSTRHRLVVLAVLLWALRLSIFLVSRIRSWGRDRRFDPFRKSRADLAKFWTAQGLWVWFTALAVTLLGVAPYHPAVRGWALGWALLFLGGFVVEGVADAQKGKVRGDGGWPQGGLWRFSRHPNYFGEMVMWWAVYGLCAPALTGWRAVGVLSPVFVMGVVLFLSGVPLLERSGEKKYGGDPRFQEYKGQTSLVVPLPPKVYAGLPEGVKRFVLLDFISEMVLKRSGPLNGGPSSKPE